MPQGAAAQQGGTTRYVYDDNGRLRAVVSPSGEAAVYEYDAAGNFTTIRRLTTNDLELLGFFPNEGGAGDLVTFVGTGFGAGVSQVSFNGASAQIIEVSPSAVIAEVPETATTGPVTIITQLGTLITPVPFTVVSKLRVLPLTATLAQGDSIAFTAVVGTGGDQSVTWSVNGVGGGNSTVGTVSTGGLYTAPTLSGNASVTFVVRATSVADPTLFGEAQVRVINPNSLGSLFAPSVSVTVGLPRAVASARAPVVSVRRGLVINGPSEIASPLVSVRRGAVIDQSAVVFSPLVSVRRGAVINGPNIASSPLVSVRYGFVIAADATFFSPFVSVTTGATISDISPRNITRGTSVTLTVTGENLSDITDLKFLNASGVVDAGITASNLIINPGGTSITATVTVTGGSALGSRVAVVSGPNGSSLAVDTGLNTIVIQ